MKLDPAIKVLKPLNTIENFAVNTDWQLVLASASKDVLADHVEDIKKGFKWKWFEVKDSGTEEQKADAFINLLQSYTPNIEDFKQILNGDLFTDTNKTRTL